MSGNSWRSALQTAPIVTAFWRGRGLSDGGGWGSSTSAVGPSVVAISPCSLWSPLVLASAIEECKLVLADLELVAVPQVVGVDPLPVDVGAVERAAVVEVVFAAAADEDRVVAGNGHVVEEDVGVGPAPDGDARLR